MSGWGFAGSSSSVVCLFQKPETNTKHVLGFQGSGSWQSDWHWDDDAGSKWWGSNDDSRTHARSMNHGC